ncbi:MAG: ribosome assembly RNA-binding protein YhbY [Polyangiaceae bacterium]
MPLTGQQTRHLRALGHHLDPVVLIGKNGLTEAVVAQLGEAITRHELIKIKLQPECPIDRGEASVEIAKALGAELVQVLGRTILFFKRNPKAARVELPKAGAKKPAKKAPPPRPAPKIADADEDDDSDVIDEDDEYGDFDEDDAPKAKHPHPRVPEDRAPVQRAAPAKKAPAKRVTTVRRGANRGEVVPDKSSRDEASPREGAKTPREGAKTPRRSDRPYNREKGARPAEKRPYNRDRSTPEARERRPFSRAGAPAAKRSPAPKPAGPRRGPR